MLPDCHMTQKNQQRSCTRRGSFIPTQQNTNQIIIMTRKTNGVTFVQYVDDYSDSARRTDTSHSVSSPSWEKNNVFYTYFHTIHSFIAIIFPLSHHSWDVADDEGTGEKVRRFVAHVAWLHAWRERHAPFICQSTTCGSPRNGCIINTSTVMEELSVFTGAW